MTKDIRRSIIERNTKETSIKVSLNLDGKGKYKIDTPAHFLNHMLEQLAKHSLMDLEITATGDTHIDYHHLTEDIGIVIGTAFRKALGEAVGIQRFAHSYITMDETLTRTVIDICNRPYLIWNVNFTQDKIGEMDTELFREWFYAFAMNARINLHVENLYGVNNHHIIESSYKSLAKALYFGTRIVNDQIQSTKGEL